MPSIKITLWPGEVHKRILYANVPAGWLGDSARITSTHAKVTLSRTSDVAKITFKVRVNMHRGVLDVAYDDSFFGALPIKIVSSKGVVLEGLDYLWVPSYVELEITPHEIVLKILS